MMLSDMLVYSRVLTEMASVDYVTVRRVGHYSKLLAFLARKFPNHPKIDRHGPGTQTYETITKWCNIETDLKPFAFDMHQTFNGIVFDAFTGEFVNDSEMASFCVYIDVTKYLVPYLPAFVLDSVRFDDEFILDSLLSDCSEEEIKFLVSQKIVSEPFSVRSDAVIYT